jgi:hypothetical protein
MIRLAYKDARWRGYSVLWSLGFAIFDLKLPNLPGDEPHISSTDAPTQPELKQPDSSGLKALHRQF